MEVRKQDEAQIAMEGVPIRDFFFVPNFSVQVLHEKSVTPVAPPGNPGERDSTSTWEGHSNGHNHINFFDSEPELDGITAISGSGAKKHLVVSKQLDST